MTITIQKSTRKVPPLPAEPGTLFWATVRGVENTLVMVSGSAVVDYCTPVSADGCYWHDAEDIDPVSVRLAKAVEA